LPSTLLLLLNPENSDKCPFCDDRETIFHAFLNCYRLKPLFSVLKDVFRKCNEVFSQEIFILGCKYVLKKKFVCQLLNFVVGQAKMAIYLSRRKKIEQDVVQNIVVLFFNLVQSGILIDFYYYKCIGDLFSFENIWSCNDALCAVFEEDLIFTIY